MKTCERCGDTDLVRKSRTLPRDVLSLRRCGCAFLCRHCRLVGLADHLLDAIVDEDT